MLVKSDRSDSTLNAQIVDSWITNADAWTHAVREGHIDTRIKITDQAVVDTVVGRAPRSVLDLGCGEGWLARALSRHGIDVLGVDVVPALIAQARAAGGCEFRVLSYADLTRGDRARALFTTRFDALVCNFSLLGADSVEALINAAPSLLNATGALIVQTLHPVSSCGDAPYVDGWRPGSWDGFGAQFTDPAPWYFRTVQSWQALFAHAGFSSVTTFEPIHPDTMRPASIIFVAS